LVLLLDGAGWAYRVPWWRRCGLVRDWLVGLVYGAVSGCVGVI